MLWTQSIICFVWCWKCVNCGVAEKNENCGNNYHFFHKVKDYHKVNQQQLWLLVQPLFWQFCKLWNLGFTALIRFLNYEFVYLLVTSVCTLFINGGNKSLFSLLNQEPWVKTWIHYYGVNMPFPLLFSWKAAWFVLSGSLKLLLLN